MRDRARRTLSREAIRAAALIKMLRMPVPPPHAALPDDVFRKQLRAAREQLKTWAASVEDFAQIDESETETFWRLSAIPRAAHACPFELIAYDDQHFDFLAGAEAYERQPLTDVKLLSELVEAIADGRIVTRVHASRNTGARRSVETVITLESAGEWRGERLNAPLAAAIRAEDCEAHDQRYVPYRQT